GMPLSVGETAVVEHLQEYVEHVRVSLFDLVEQHHLVGPPPHRLGERAAFLVADIAWWRADQTGDRMFLHVFRHIDAYQRILVVEQVFGQRLGQLGLTDPGRPQEHERPDGSVRILQPRARTAHRGRYRLDRLRLADDALAELLFHAQQFFLLAFEHLLDRHAGPARDHLRHVVGGHRLLDHGALALCGLDAFELLLDFRNATIG